MKAKELVSIVDFMYYGEVNVYQEDLNTFLNLAEEIELKGLNGSSDQDILKQDQNISHANDTRNYQTALEATQLTRDNFKHSEIETYPLIKTEMKIKTTSSKQLVTINRDLAEQIDSMLERRDGLWTCTICGKQSKNKCHTKEHVEIHLDGISYPCNNCGKIFRSRTPLKMHSYQCNNKITF